MQQAELLELIDKGEDSRTQFKKDFKNAIQLAQEMVAFSKRKVSQEELMRLFQEILKDEPNIEFINDTSAERFKVIIRRPD